MRGPARGSSFCICPCIRSIKTTNPQQAESAGVICDPYGRRVSVILLDVYREREQGGKMSLEVLKLSCHSNSAMTKRLLCRPGELPLSMIESTGYGRRRVDASTPQLVEHRIPDPKVIGSSPVSFMFLLPRSREALFDG
ncbi:hypothetical protein THAOC_22792 [Thalassiosira oceanica]|uniref:Uncharacterized protein n=1 Tax=Thalassiosira oceanica TaxID=159749 RepID=K0RTQ6_THAOC|nr:hypothetical protein THAOC_22792 [Thalassiosira oceanica]|eukprot:EJK57193.1 hypothetical protein THAOC_22792 [Thalassiosira oceanica]